MVQFKYLDRVAYSEPKRFPRSGSLIDAGSRIGTKLVQVIYLRPVAFGARLGKRRR